MNDYIDELRGRFDELEQREKQALVALASFLALVVLYLGVWSPVNSFVDSSRLDHARQLELFTYLQSTLDDARAAADAGASPGEGSNLITSVSRTARSVGVSPSRMQPEGSGTVSVWFDGVPFTQLMLWLERLQTDQGIVVRQISMERKDDTPGQVSARLVVRQ